MRKRVWLPIVILGLVPAAGVAALLVFSVVTSVIGGEVEVRNDEPQTVEFSCDLMDAPSAAPGRTAPIELDSVDRYQSCLAYYLDGPKYLGCFTVDTHRDKSGSTILLSTHLKREPIRDCR
jgi:hypothetical protein